MPVILDERATEDWMKPTRAGPAVAEAAARAGALRSADDAARLAVRKQREERGPRAELTPPWAQPDHWARIVWETRVVTLAWAGLLALALVVLCFLLFRAI